eukprot:12240689-Alexandrium_andersonii.AAC.1
MQRGVPGHTGMRREAAGCTRAQRGAMRWGAAGRSTEQPETPASAGRRSRVQRDMMGCSGPCPDAMGRVGMQRGAAQRSGVPWDAGDSPEDN